jgi:hypothetical protein
LLSTALFQPALEARPFHADPGARLDLVTEHQGRALLMDVAMTHALRNTTSVRRTLESDGGAATAYEAVKRARYASLVQEGQELVPLVVDTYGAWGESAWKWFPVFARGYARRLSGMSAQEAERRFYDRVSSTVADSVARVLLANSAPQDPSFSQVAGAPGILSQEDDSGELSQCPVSCPPPAAPTQDGLAPVARLTVSSEASSSADGGQGPSWAGDVYDAAGWDPEGSNGVTQDAPDGGPALAELPQDFLEPVPVPVPDGVLEVETSLQPASGRSSPPACPVCQDAIEAEAPRRRIRRCGHAFHDACIRRWFSERPTCPCCRLDLRACGAVPLDSAGVGGLGLEGRLDLRADQDVPLGSASVDGLDLEGFRVDYSARRRRPLTDAARRDGTTLRLAPPGNGWPDCPVCQDEIQVGQACRTINVCAHSFHEVCIDGWFAYQPTCPVCRADVRRPPQRAHSAGAAPRRRR